MCILRLLRNPPLHGWGCRGARDGLLPLAALTAALPSFPVKRLAEADALSLGELQGELAAVSWVRAAGEVGSLQNGLVLPARMVSIEAAQNGGP